MTDHEAIDEEEFDPTEYDVTIHRTFDAPRERVFEAWTDPERVSQWWGPEGFTVPHCEMDARPGGGFRIDMRAPDGTVYSNAGEFNEVVEPERLVVTSRAFEDEDGNFGLEVRQTVTFVDRDGKTELTLRAEVVTATPDVAEALEGMETGWNQSLDKLAEFVDRSGDGSE
ncbi:SRPBCC domain-containing protein [Halomarina halobia]|uniref:SRPBCC domain-containing protein n=1 Tax=Halomarina halobia TaxID=3033386 RepID=A0ABD6AD59_9EURY|nr:SRPBCC domain-containing protein [Halomarina sp. PSR21]